MTYSAELARKSRRIKWILSLSADQAAAQLIQDECIRA